jgi:Cu/Ag efflux protein CusF
MSKHPFAAVLVAAAALPAIAGAQPATAPAPRGPVSAIDTVTLTAVVEKLDLATRQVTLRGASGTVYDFTVSPDFKDLDKVKVGDTVAVNYTQAIAARLATAAEAGRPASASASATPRGNGKMAVGAEVTERLKVVSIDLDHNTVTLTGPGGQSETVEVRDAQLRERLKTLKPGDELFVTYSESLALSLLPTGKR